MALAIPWKDLPAPERMCAVASLSLCVCCVCCVLRVACCVLSVACVPHGFTGLRSGGCASRKCAHSFEKECTTHNCWSRWICARPRAICIPACPPSRRAAMQVQLCLLCCFIVRRAACRVTRVSRDSRVARSHDSHAGVAQVDRMCRAWSKKDTKCVCCAGCRLVASSLTVSLQGRAVRPTGWGSN